MKRVAAVFLVLALCSGMFGSAAGAVFADIHEQRTQTAVTLLQNLGIVAGFDDGTFRPDNNLTRAQFCKMAVMLSGTQDVAAYEGFTVFPDVRANHWGRGHINAAVRSLKIITGFPDGTFRPDTPINYAQAVTTLMRMLGYSDADVGLSWPSGYLDKAGAIGLTKGIILKDNDTITRGLAAQMFHNAIFTSNKAGVKYSDELGFAEQKVIVLQPDGIGPDGATRGIIAIGGSGFYPCRSALGIEEYTRGTLLLDKDEYALNWTPDKQTRREVTVKETGPMSVTEQDGNKVGNIPSDAAVYINGEMKEWEECWTDIPPGQALSIFFNDAGAIDYMFTYQPTDDGVVKILTAEPEKGRNPLPSLDIDSGARVYKNGAPVSWAALRANDVLVYNADAKTVNATDFRITGVYENALPSREMPNEVTTLGGSSFKVLPEARSKLADIKIGETLTFSFTPDGRVADVTPAKKPVYQPGIINGDGSVTLYNGILISGENPWTKGPGEGSPALACMTESGKLDLQAIPAKDSETLDMKKMKAGDADIATYAVIFDICGTGGRAVLTDRLSLPDVVDAKNVLAVSFDSGGNANLIVTRDVTGDAWAYGFASVEPGKIEETVVTDEHGEVFEIITTRIPDRVTVSDQNGGQTFDDPRSYSRNVNKNNIYAVAVGTNSLVLACKACVRVNNIRRYDFSGNTSVTVSGVARPIPEDMMVYVESTKKYISLAEARVYSNDFSVYLDKPAAEGGKPRFIIAR